MGYIGYKMGLAWMKLQVGSDAEINFMDGPWFMIIFGPLNIIVTGLMLAFGVDLKGRSR